MQMDLYKGAADNMSSVIIMATPWHQRLQRLLSAAAH